MLPYGTIVGAQAAADAPVFDNDFQRIAPPDRADGAADHAEWIAALPARGRHQVFVEAQAFAHQAAHAVVCIGAGAYALIAARAAFQVEHQQALRFHQSLGEKLVHGNIFGSDGAASVFFQPFVGRGLQAVPNVGKLVEHQLKIFSRDAHDLDVVESRAGRGARAAGEQRDLAEVAAPRQIGEHQFASELLFGNLHEADADQIEAVGGDRPGGRSPVRG